LLCDGLCHDFQQLRGGQQGAHVRRVVGPPGAPSRPPQLRHAPQPVRCVARAALVDACDTVGGAQELRQGAVFQNRPAQELQVSRLGKRSSGRARGTGGEKGEGGVAIRSTPEALGRAQRTQRSVLQHRNAAEVLHGQRIETE